jgi:hypothetical protein
MDLHEYRCGWTDERGRGCVWTANHAREHLPRYR